ncbi:MAG: hypothetical protein HRT61_15765 [Ekhidna sp.]|nr:hypothetical protein [Ekhidna sp.]
MRFLDTIYFHIYNVYYKDGNYNNDIPHLTAFGLVGSSFSLILAAVVSLSNYLLGRQRLSFEFAVFIIVLGLIFFFFKFLYGSRYEKIYNEIRKSKVDNIWFKILSWLLVLAGFGCVGLYSYVFN